MRIDYRPPILLAPSIRETGPRPASTRDFGHRQPLATRQTGIGVIPERGLDRLLAGSVQDMATSHAVAVSLPCNRTACIRQTHDIVGVITLL